jgi:hypothetical protein
MYMNTDLFHDTFTTFQSTLLYTNTLSQGELITPFKSENLKRRSHVGVPGVDKRIILKLILNKYGVRVWTGFNRLKIKFSGGFLGDTLVSLRDPYKARHFFIS